jgi:hypothetical protein
VCILGVLVRYSDVPSAGSLKYLGAMVWLFGYHWCYSITPVMYMLLCFVCILGVLA